MKLKVTGKKALLAIGLVAAFSSTSFAANQGGGKKASSGSCIAGGQAKETQLKLGQSGFDDAVFKQSMGPHGPQIQIGDTTIFFNPSSGKDQKNESDENPQNWCISNPDLRKQTQSEKKFVCGDGQKEYGDSSSGSKDKPYVFKINMGGQTATAQVIQEKDSKGNVKSSRIVIRGSGEVKNYIRITADYKKNDKNVSGSMNIAAIAIEGSSPDTVAGVMKSAFKGTVAEESDENVGAPRLTTCQNTNEDKGQMNSIAGAGNNAVDLAGSCLIDRGSDVAFVDQYKAECKPNTDAQAVAGMAKEDGRR